MPLRINDSGVLILAKAIPHRRKTSNSLAVKWRAPFFFGQNWLFVPLQGLCAKLRRLNPCRRRRNNRAPAFFISSGKTHKSIVFQKKILPSSVVRCSLDERQWKRKPLLSWREHCYAAYTKAKAGRESKNRKEIPGRRSSISDINQ